MKSKEQWIPTKFVNENGKWIGSKNPEYLAIYSRLGIEKIAEFYEKACAKHAKGLLLDVGCGKVPFYGIYKQYINEAICIDWEVVSQHNPFLDKVCDLNQPLPFENNIFDTVLMSDVLEHIRFPENLIKEISRVLKTGGKLLMNVPFLYNLHDEPHDYFRYTKYALQAFCQDAGLNIIYLEAVGGVPEVLANIFIKNGFAIPYIGKPITSIFQSFMRFFLRTKIAKSISFKTKDVFPLSYQMIAQKK